MSATHIAEAKALPTLLTSRPNFARREGLPEDYPKSLRVRNTFIDTSAERSPSLDAFYREREVSTCPSSQVGKLRNLFQDLSISGDVGAQGPRAPPARADPSAEASPQRPQDRAEGTVPAAVLSLAESLVGQPGHVRPREEMIAVTAPVAFPVPLAPYPQKAALCLTANGICPLPEVFAPGYAVGLAGVSATLPAGAAALAASTVVAPAPALAAAEMPAQRAVLGAAVAAKQGGSGQTDAAAPCPLESSPRKGHTSRVVGSPDMPSVGSAGHALGRCKPCAFYHTKGCANDITCQFCHLCDADEKKRRRKEKFETRRAAHKLRSVLSGS